MVDKAICRKKIITSAKRSVQKMVNTSENHEPLDFTQYLIHSVYSIGGGVSYGVEQTNTVQRQREKSNDAREWYKKIKERFTVLTEEGE